MSQNNIITAQPVTNILGTNNSKIATLAVLPGFNPPQKPKPKNGTKGVTVKGA